MTRMQRKRGARASQGMISTLTLNKQVLDLLTLFMKGVPMFHLQKKLSEADFE